LTYSAGSSGTGEDLLVLVRLGSMKIEYTLTFERDYLPLHSGLVFRALTLFVNKVARAVETPRLLGHRATQL